MSQSSSSPSLRVISLYEDVLNIYSDRGNRLAVQARAAELGVDVDVDLISIGDQLPADVDLVLIGGGQDREQEIVAADLLAKGETLRNWAATNVAMLAVCGGFQLFGRGFRNSKGVFLDGIEVFDCVSVTPNFGNLRFVGDVISQSSIEGLGTIVGYENHAGQTFLGESAIPFAEIEIGFGNNGVDRTEGVWRNSCVGTYLHGSILPNNSQLLDWLFKRAIEHRMSCDSNFDSVVLEKMSEHSKLNKASEFARQLILDTVRREQE